MCVFFRKANFAFYSFFITYLTIISSCVLKILHFQKNEYLLRDGLLEEITRKI